MPEPPSSSFITRFVLENPWPLMIALAAVGIALVWLGMREGLWRRVQIGVALVGASLLLGVIGWLVETVGERGERVVRRFVEAVVAEDVAASTAMLVSDGGTFNVGSPNNPGEALDVIREQLRTIARNYDIEKNRITMLRGYRESSERAIVHLGCWTEVTGGWGPTVTQWVIRVEHQPDGDWKITRITWISMNNRPAPNRFP